MWSTPQMVLPLNTITSTVTHTHKDTQSTGGVVRWMVLRVWVYAWWTVSVCAVHLKALVPDCYYEKGTVKSSLSIGCTHTQCWARRSHMLDFCAWLGEPELWVCTWKLLYTERISHSISWGLPLGDNTLYSVHFSRNRMKKQNNNISPSVVSF